MKKLVIIPEFNFTELLVEIVSFYRKHLEEAQIIITTQQLDKFHFLKEFTKNVHIVYVQPGLKYAYKRAYMLNKLNFGCELFIINEHDIIPNTNALYACLHIMEDPPIDDVGSVSCNYKWNDNYCYPYSPNWFKDKPIIERNDVGRIVRVGAQGVPFSFSIWRSHLFENIDDPIFPDTWKLDYHFGNHVYTEKGFWHLRLLDYHVEHYEKGVNSWKEK